MWLILDFHDQIEIKVRDFVTVIEKLLILRPFTPRAL